MILTTDTWNDEQKLNFGIKICVKVLILKWGYPRLCFLLKKKKSQQNTTKTMIILMNGPDNEN